MRERYAPGGPLALALDALADRRYDEALDRLEELLALAHGLEQATTREHAVRLAVRIGLEAPAALHSRVERIAAAARLDR